MSEYSTGEAPLGLTRLKAALDPVAKAQTKLTIVKDFMMSGSVRCCPKVQLLSETVGKQMNKRRKKKGSLLYRK
jgi:hypothetical protein